MTVTLDSGRSFLFAYLKNQTCKAYENQQELKQLRISNHKHHLPCGMWPTACRLGQYPVLGYHIPEEKAKNPAVRPDFLFVCFEVVECIAATHQNELIKRYVICRSGFIQLFK